MPIGRNREFPADRFPVHEAGEPLAEDIRGELGEEGGPMSEAGKAQSHIEWRAADTSLQPDGRDIGLRVGKDIEQ